MKSKLILLSTFYVFALVFSACCGEDKLPYYDFSSISLLYPEGEEISENGSFTLLISEEEVEYLAIAPTLNLGLINKAYALSCPSDGDNGRKYSVVNVEITSDADFDADHAAGTSLKDIFTAEKWDSDVGDYIQVRLDQYEDQNSVYKLKLDERPTLSVEHHFTITLTKDNGEIISATTNTINWL